MPNPLPDTGDRIAKLLARAGVASRREIERMIADGRVALEGKVLDTPAVKRPNLKGVTVDGKPVAHAEPARLFAFHKPSGLITAESDPRGRPTIYTALRNALPKGTPRMMPVGRLDFTTEGLLLMTNDGELANLLTKASSRVPKTYLVKVSGTPTEDALQKLRAGVRIPDGEGKTQRYIRTALARVSWYKRGDNPWFEVTLIQGRNRQIRKMFEVVGHRVEKIKRVQYGPLQLDVDSGEYRPLSIKEVAQLKAAATGRRRQRAD